MKLFIASLVVAGFLFCTNLMATDNCCDIVSTDLQTGMVTARDIASGRTFEFHVTNQQLLEQLDPGTTFGRTSVTGLYVFPEELKPDGLDQCCVFAPPIDAIDVSPDGMNPMDLKRGVDIGTSRVPLPDDWTPSHSLAPGVTLQILSLKRLGARVVKFEFSLSNSTDNAYGLDSLGFGARSDLSNLALMDYDGGMKYGVVTDNENVCACSRTPGETLRIYPGQNKTFYAHFTAPPTDVDRVSINIPNGVSIDNVPIRQ